MEFDRHSQPAEEQRKLIRIPQLIGLILAAGSVVVLFVALWLPDVFNNSGDGDGNNPGAFDFQQTEESEERFAESTSEVSLSDLAPEETPAPTATVAPQGSPTQAQSQGSESATTAPTEVPASTSTPEPAFEQAGCTESCVDVGVAMEEFPGDFEAIVEFGEMGERMPDMVMFFQAWGDDDREFKDWLPQLSDMDVSPLIT